MFNLPHAHKRNFSLCFSLVFPSSHSLLSPLSQFPFDLSLFCSILPFPCSFPLLFPFTVLSHFSFPPPPQSTRPVWQETISPLEREAEKNALAKLEGRADYLKNPRCVIWMHEQQYYVHVHMYIDLRRQQTVTHARTICYSKRHPPS